MRNIIETLLERSDLQVSNNAVVIKRPCEILISANVVNKIKDIYAPTFERGGLLLLQPTPTRGQLFGKDLVVIPNQSAANSAYEPNEFIFKAEIAKAINAGFLPVAIHTHPTKLGLSGYDNKRVNFYLSSSQPDQRIAAAGVDIAGRKLLLPEAIAVVDTRFDTGFSIAFYEGGILPASLAALSKTELAVAGAAGVSLLVWQRPLLLLLAVVFLYSEYRRPKYTPQNDGGLLVEFRK